MPEKFFRISSKFKYQLAFTAVCIASAAVSALVSGNIRSAYGELVLPRFAPPAAVFPAVWTILYALQGAGAGTVFVSFSPYRERALAFFAVQLAAQFMWPVIFFGAQKYMAGFFWLLLTVYAAFACARQFATVNKTAAAMQLPYLVWLIFCSVTALLAALMN